jgi:hypothetical protein
MRWKEKWWCGWMCEEEWMRPPTDSWMMDEPIWLRCYMPQKRSDGLDECMRGNGWDDQAMDGREMVELARAFLAAIPTLRFVCPALASCARPISGFGREERSNLRRSAVHSCPPGNKDSIGM